LLASILSFFLFAAAIARSISGCATFNVGVENSRRSVLPPTDPQRLIACSWHNHAPHISHQFFA